MNRTGRDTASVDPVREATARQDAQGPAGRDAIGQSPSRADAEHMIRWETEGGALDRISPPG